MILVFGWFAFTQPDSRNPLSASLSTMRISSEDSCKMVIASGALRASRTRYPHERKYLARELRTSTSRSNTITVSGARPKTSRRMAALFIGYTTAMEPPGSLTTEHRLDDSKQTLKGVRFDNGSFDRFGDSISRRPNHFDRGI